VDTGHTVQFSNLWGKRIQGSRTVKRPNFDSLAPASLGDFRVWLVHYGRLRFSQPEEFFLVVIAVFKIV
jgi:hypothetical protein